MARESDAAANNRAFASAFTKARGAAMQQDGAILPTPSDLTLYNWTLWSASQPAPYVVQHTARYTIQYTVQYTVQFTVQYIVQYTVQYVAQYIVQYIA